MQQVANLSSTPTPYRNPNAAQTDLPLRSDSNFEYMNPLEHHTEAQMLYTPVEMSLNSQLYHESPKIVYPGQQNIHRSNLDYSESQSLSYSYPKPQNFEGRYQADQFYQIEGANKMNVINFGKNPDREQYYQNTYPGGNSQFVRYTENTTKSQGKLGFGAFIDSSQKSADFNKTLQYKVPINSVQYQDSRMVASRDNLNRKAPQNVFSIRKQEDELFEQRRNRRDRTPNAANRVNFEEPYNDYVDRKRSKSKDKPVNKKRTKSTKTKQSVEVKQKDEPKQSAPKHKFRQSKKSVSSKKSNASAKRKKQIENDEEEEYEYVKVKKRKNPKIVYENDSTSSEDREPKRKIVVESKKNKAFDRRKSSKRRTVEELQGEKKHRRSISGQRKSEQRYYNEIDDEYEEPEEPRQQTSPKKNKKMLFQVDINLDSKIVRIAIHEGDNIDKIVKKFNDVFQLKPKQIAVLKQRLKNEYEKIADKEEYNY